MPQGGARGQNLGHINSWVLYILYSKNTHDCILRMTESYPHDCGSITNALSGFHGRNLKFIIRFPLHLGNCYNRSFIRHNRNDPKYQEG